ncbi:MAG: LacI family DNA-binding transcriptional regulator [Devosia sp.]
MASDSKPPPQTIRGIAKAAGVSTATVSRVINAPETVKPSTRESVLKVIHENDYINDGMARALAGGRTKTIGVAIPTITNSIYASSTQAIQRLCQTAGYAVILVVSDFDPVRERELIRRLVERRVDGIILTGADHDPGLHRVLERHSIPYVVTWRVEAEAAVPCVAFDNYAAGRLAMDHLLDLGHRRIGLICGESAVNDRALQRRKAYCDALTERGIAVDTALIHERAFEFVDGYEAAGAILSTPPRASAIFAANDIQAVGAIAACRGAGLSVPGDISIIGFDDLPIAQFSAPRLTTVRVPAADMGRIAAERLLALVDGKAVEGSHILPVDLIVRDSTAPIPT